MAQLAADKNTKTVYTSQNSIVAGNYVTSYTLESPTTDNSRDYTCTFSVAAGNDGVKLIGDAAGTTNLHVASKELQPVSVILKPETD